MVGLFNCPGVTSGLLAKLVVGNTDQQMSSEAVAVDFLWDSTGSGGGAVDDTTLNQQMGVLSR